jgi:hypothetical protein
MLKEAPNESWRDRRFGSSTSCESGLLAAAGRERIESRCLRLVVPSWSGILVKPHQPRRMTMEAQAKTISPASRREPWNKGKLIGQKPPLRPKHLWSIRTRLQMNGWARDLAIFNLAIDSKLRGFDTLTPVRCSPLADCCDQAAAVALFQA